MKRKPNQKHLVLIGDYRIPEAERLLDALTGAHIKFKIECDDGIRFEPRRMGDFGTSAKIRFWATADEEKHVRQIQDKLFGEFSP